MRQVMREFLRRWGPWLKLLLFTLVLGGVAWHFVRILQREELGWDQMASVRPLELVLGGVLYLVGLAFSAFFWLWLLQSLGNPISTIPGVRAYYISHVGKYAPGKGLALVMRTAMAARAGARPGLAVLTAVYETLTTMAAGAAIAGVMMALVGAGPAAKWWHVVGLLVLAGVPILPGVFNPVVRRLAKRFLTSSSVIPPALNNRTLVLGLLATSIGWFALGASLEAVLRSLSLTPWTVEGWLRSTGIFAFAYVFGFIVPTPGGLGPREGALQWLLTPQIGEANAVLVAILFRLLTIVAEVAFALVLWFLPSHTDSQLSVVSGQLPGPENVSQPTTPLHSEASPLTTDH